MVDNLVCLHVDYPPQWEDIITMELVLGAPWGWHDEGLWGGLRRATVHFHLPEHATSLEAAIHKACPEATTSTQWIENTDWSAAWRQFFTPLSIGRFTVVPSWLAQEFPGPWTIIIEPKMAFGTGHHATTALCLEALDTLAAQGAISPGQRFLDLGTGSGILALAAHRLGLTGLGLDIDSVAVANAQENAILNGATGVTFAVGSIEGAPEKFHLVLANILAGPLLDMAQAITARLHTHGFLILSGILQGEQATQVEHAYCSLGLPQPQRSTQGEWACLVFRS